MDDYVTKPCRITELFARARVLLRGRDPRRSERVLGHGDLLLDDAVCRAWRGQQALDLTPAEHRLLRHFLIHAEQVLSKEQIAWQVWGESRGDWAYWHLRPLGPALAADGVPGHQGDDEKRPGYPHMTRGRAETCGMRAVIYAVIYAVAYVRGWKGFRSGRW